MARIDTLPKTILPYPAKRLQDWLGKEPRCSDCDRVMLGTDWPGIYCPIWKEEIWDETVALECEHFE